MILDKMLRPASILCVCLLPISWLAWGFGGEISSEKTLTISTEEAVSAPYWVYLAEKEATDFEPETYFAPEALARRRRMGLPLSDARDWPLSAVWVTEIAAHAHRLRQQSRWLNAVSVEATPEQAQAIAALPFVVGVAPFSQTAEVSSAGPRQIMGRLDTLLSLTRELMQLDTLAAHGLTGKGVRIAILDAGFLEANTHPALAAVRERGGILRTWDFYQGDSNVYLHSHHGMEVMSCIAGTYGDRLLGCAPEADFLLARIEHASREKAIEEDHWAAAAEWADRYGADLINSSVTYTFKRYTYDDMDGKTAPVSIAARIATEKGILVVASMGNEGKKKWKYLGAPADVPEVLSVGGSMPMLPLRTPFASVGPNAQGQTKPDVAAPGFVLTAKRKGKYDENAGTSFSAPLVTGIAACLLQQEPESSPAQLAQRIRESGHFYPYYDYDLGYGVPSMRKLFRENLASEEPPFRVGFKGDSVILAFDTTYLRTDTSRFPHGRIVSFHLQEAEDGPLAAYQNIRLPNKSQYYFFRRRMELAGTLRIWMDDYLFERAVEAEPSAN